MLYPGWETESTKIFGHTQCTNYTSSVNDDYHYFRKSEGNNDGNYKSIRQH